MNDLHTLGVAELAAAIAGKQTSSVEAAQHLLARAKQHAALGAWLAFNEDATLAQARAADARVAAGERTPLLGVPLAHKDIFVTRDFPTTAGSKMLQGYQSPFDATVVQRLGAQGAVTLGKLNCDEFAMGGSNENSAYGPAHNPWDTTRVPGGSSGGTAVAVAARLLPAATGTDTGGS
ncbi:MAG: amidase, partial [Variovorax sp.]|nr:amidase [Variovorax sp.]